MYASIDFEDSLRFLPSKYRNNIIEKAQKMTIGKSDEELFQMSRQHLLNALSYRAPRLYDSSSHVSYFYLFQTSRIWQNILLIVSYLFMYLVFLSFQKPSQTQNWIQWSFLIVFWFDVLLEVYHKYYETLRQSSRFQTRFFFKIGLLILLTLDQLIVLVQILQDFDGFRPFLVLRCCNDLFNLGLPVLYHPALRKNIEAMQDLYQDVFVYIFFYALVILIFAMFLTQIIELKTDEPIDQYTQNYGDLGKDLFLMYCLSSYEGYPDNQIRSIQQDQRIQIFYIIFILLNMFFFVTIPTSLLFKTFKESRSRILLIDEIKQQNSLILAFICLCKNEPQVHRDRLIKFLLFVFKNKPGYTDFIMKVVLQLDENGNGKIQVSQFMQLCKIMQAHGRVDPPLFKDVKCWIYFRGLINSRYNLKQILLSTRFNIYVSLIIFVSVINAILYLYTRNMIFRVIDDMISYFYVLELVLKFIGIGPQNYFKDPWNRRDFIIVVVIIILEVFSYLHVPWIRQFNKNNFDVLAKFLRAYKLAVACKYLSDRSQYVQKSEFYIKASRLVTQIMMTIPIVIQFFPLYLILFYFFGVLGVQIFTNVKAEVSQDQSPYNNYQKVSNFDSFLYSQFFMIQTLVEGGWSVVGYDHAYRYGIPFSVTMMMFVICHFSITLILSSLVKGVIWQIYEQVDIQLDRKIHENVRMIENERQIKIKKERLKEVKNRIDLNQALTLQNLIAREIYENKVDFEINKKILNALNNVGDDYMRKRDLRKRTHCIPTLVKDLNLINVDEIDVMLGEQQDMGEILLKRIMSELSIDDIKEEDLKDEDIQDQMERLISMAIIDRKQSYTQTIVYPGVLVEFLGRKVVPISRYNQEMLRRSRNSNVFRRAMSFESKSDIYESEFDLYSQDFDKNEQSLGFLASSLKSLLEVKSSSRDRKAKIISNLVGDGVISEQQGLYVLSKKQQKNVSLHPEWILRKTFLTNTSQKLVKKLQIDFFSSVYGDEIKQVNNVTVQPLLRLESKLTFSLSNILKYKQIGDNEFWGALCQIENSVSTKLLKKGSLFKFVYQIDSLNESWFTVKVKENGEIKPHFIKNGIWVYNSNIKNDEIFIGKDMFYWRELQEGVNMNMNQNRNGVGFSRYGDDRRNIQEFRGRFIKMLYQSFESIAFCLKSDDQFWGSNPSELIYDFFSVFKNVENTARQVQKRFSISNIMFFILSNEGERIFNSNKAPLNYELTDIKIVTENVNKSNISNSTIRPSLADKIKYKLDDSKQEIFERIKKVENMDDEQIEQTQGLPHAFIVNLLQEIRDIVKLNEENFVYRIERIVNRDYLNKDGGRVSWRRSAVLGDLNISRRISQYMM